MLVQSMYKEASKATEASKGTKCLITARKQIQRSSAPACDSRNTVSRAAVESLPEVKSGGGENHWAKRKLPTGRYSCVGRPGTDQCAQVPSKRRRLATRPLVPPNPFRDSRPSDIDVVP